MELKLTLHHDEEKSREAVKQAVEKRNAAKETVEEAWERIFAMKNSEPDMKRLQRVRKAMQAGEMGRCPNERKRFSKAEALRLWTEIHEKERKQTLLDMVTNTPSNYWLITTETKLEEFLALLQQESEIVFDVETTGIDVYEDYIVGHVITAVQADIHAYIPTKHQTETPQLSHSYVLDVLRPIYEDERVGKIAHNAKFDMHMLRRDGIQVRGLAWDTQIAMHVLNENERLQGRSYQLKDLVSHYLKIPSQTYSELFGKQGFHEVSDLAVALAYAAKDGDVTLQLRDFQRTHLKKLELLDYYGQVENPTIGVTLEMEQAGFCFDSERARELSQQLGKELAEIEKELRQHFGDINLNSPAQLSEKLYNELKLDKHLPKGTKRSTDVQTLKCLAPHHEGIPVLLAYREKTKLLGTYIDALPKQVREDGRVHGTFNSMGAGTGRLAANNPNLQNQPKFVRSLFIAPQGQVILSGDFSQQEPRWLAHYTGEDVLIEAYREDKDLYATAASNLFQVPLSECLDGSKYRKMMKTGILAVMYGTGPKTLATQLGIKNEEAKEFIKKFYSTYPKVKAWIEGNERFAKRYGYVKLHMERKRRLPEARSQDTNERMRAMRQATNAIIQGSAAIQTKLTMIELQKLCREKGWTMAFSVHDEIGVYAPETITREDVREFERVMLETVKLKVPNKTDIEISRRWGEGKTVEEWFDNERRE